MKNLYFFLLLMFICSCSKDQTTDPKENDPLQEAIFKQKNSSFGKVLQGNDGIYNYKAFGNFKEGGTSGIFIPQDIAFIEQTLIGTNERMIIKLNQNFLPISIYNINSNIKDTIEYHVFYAEEEILILFDEENEDDSYTTLSEIILPISVSGGSEESSKTYNKIQDNSDCEPLNEENDIHPCSDNNIYEDIAESWENYTEGTPIHKVGRAVSWIIQISIAKICDKNVQNSSNKSMSFQGSGVSCEVFEEKKSDEDLCGILLSCESDCAGDLYGAAYKTTCNSCIGGKTQKMPLRVSWTYSDLSEGCWTMYAHVTGGEPPYNISWGDESTVFCGTEGDKGGVSVTDKNGCTAESTWIIRKNEETTANKSKFIIAPVLSDNIY